MRLQGLLQPLKENEKFISILNELKKKSFPIDIVGLFRVREKLYNRCNF